MSEACFFLYVKVLISLLNIGFFRLGGKFWKSAKTCKYMFSVFFCLQKPDPKARFFSLCKTAHFLTKHCIFSAWWGNFEKVQKLANICFRYFFVCKNPIRGAGFCLYAKLLIFLLNIAFFQLGGKFWKSAKTCK